MATPVSYKELGFVNTRAMFEDARKNGYAVTQGVPQLRDKLADEVRREYGHDDRELFVTCGTSGGATLRDRSPSRRSCGRTSLRPASSPQRATSIPAPRPASMVCRIMRNTAG